MNCAICAEPAERFQSDEGWEERVCPRCGHYKVAVDLVEHLIEEGQIFDIEKTRLWLWQTRVECPTPEITLANVILVVGR